jgi:hypothetical protein
MSRVVIIILSILSLGSFFGGSFVLYDSIRNIILIPKIVETQNMRNAIVVTVSDKFRTIEQDVSFVVENEKGIYKSYFIRTFFKDYPKPKQHIQVQSDEKKRLWLINGYIKETYINQIVGIVLSVFLLIISVFFIIVTVICIKRYW